MTTEDSMWQDPKVIKELRYRYDRLIEDYKNLQETVRYQDRKICELRECLNAVLDDSLVTGMKSWKDKTFNALEETRVATI